MRLLAACAVVLGMSLAAMTASRAMPVAPMGQGEGSSGNIILVAGGCGAGWHRGPHGGCRPMYNCPPGWHSGAFGRRCFRNW